ncbi:MAG TPA: TetR/AcrR family transcriptional regulator [Gemmatimonadaceae bacterium]
MSEPAVEPRWRRLPEERPRQIIESALAVFGERGLAVARLEDIAKRAGLSKGTIYLYFANKEELFREVVRSTVISKLEEREQLLGEPGTATEVLEQFMRTYWKYLRSSEFAPIFRLVHAEIHNFPDLAAFYGEEVVARGHRLIATLITNGIESGEFRDNIDPRVAARMLASTFVMHGVWCTHREYFDSVAKKTDDDVLDELIDFFFHALRPFRSDASESATGPLRS